MLIAGAGIAGLEAALALRDLAGDRVDVELCDPRSEFVFRPFVIGEPYGAVRSFRYELEQLCAALRRLVPGRARSPRSSRSGAWRSLGTASGFPMTT